MSVLSKTYVCKFPRAFLKNRILAQEKEKLFLFFLKSFISGLPSSHIQDRTYGNKNFRSFLRFNSQIPKTAASTILFSKMCVFWTQQTSTLARTYCVIILYFLRKTRCVCVQLFWWWSRATHTHTPHWPWPAQKGSQPHLTHMVHTLNIF